MSPFIETIYGRLQAISIKLHGHVWNGFSKTLRLVLVRTWCRSTTKPDVADRWNSLKPEEGHDDVTSYFLARYVFGGNIGVTRINDGQLHFIAQINNGEGVSVIDYCRDFTKQTPVFETTLEPEVFLTRFSDPSGDDPNLDVAHRSRIFKERFEKALRNLEDTRDCPKI